jgi:hypothetical protein
MTTLTQRRVLLLETDERPGLVAAIANACADHGVSLEITTGADHVLISFAADDTAVAALRNTLGAIPGVSGVHSYAVASNQN